MVLSSQSPLSRCPCWHAALGRSLGHLILARQSSSRRCKQRCCQRTLIENFERCLPSRTVLLRFHGILHRSVDDRLLPSAWFTSTDDKWVPIETLISSSFQAGVPFTAPFKRSVELRHPILGERWRWAKSANPNLERSREGNNAAHHDGSMFVVPPLDVGGKACLPAGALYPAR